MMGTKIHPNIYEAKAIPEYLKLASAASLTNYSVDTLRRWIRNGQLTGYRNSKNTNSAVLVNRDELMALIAPIPTVGNVG